MAVIKLNEVKMAKNKKPKPTNNDFVIVINSLIQDIHSLKNDMNTIMGAFDMYVDFKKDGEAFESHVNSKITNNKGNDEIPAAGQDNQVADTRNTAD